MQVAKRCPPAGLAQHAADKEGAVWILIVILIGVACFALLSLLDKVGG